ncbi:uncharacterized protein LOC106721326 [Papilio machaon]|uniref:uncharacterized protein LOC106721326 n=1 Tax=Papilio machaon TaxID=76193 RepID=UPI001E665E24|nr:uncharacterized protein LOC106721326 [Papilio machaon]
MGTLHYDEPKSNQFASWDTGITPTTSIDLEKPLFEQNSNQLTVIQKNEVLTNRPIIPATTNEKLAFYRAYVSSPSKTQIVCTQQAQFNKYLWFHIMNVFCKSLPNTYIYMFLSSYVPDQHLFLSKMVPLAYGTNWAFLAASVIYLVLYTDTVVLLLDYIVCGIFFKNPWNRHRYVDISNTSIYFMFLWITAIFNYKQLYNRRIWKMLHNVQIILTALYLITFGHLMITYFETDLKIIPIAFDEYVRIIWAADTDVLSESMTAPPIVHVLTSRSTTKINPDRDSIAMIISNSIYYLFRVSLVTTFEVLFLYCLYPLGRLVDDITFFHGVSPTKFRIINFRIVPVYYMIV